MVVVITAGVYNFDGKGDQSLAGTPFYKHSRCRQRSRMAFAPSDFDQRKSPCGDRSKRWWQRRADEAGQHEQIDPLESVMTGSGSITVRDAVIEDMYEVQSIYAHYVAHGLATFEEIPPSVEELFRRRTAVIDLGLPYLVAEVETRVVGYSYAMAYHPRAAYRFTIEDSVYVAHDLVGRGIGRALLGELIARCELGPWRQMLAVIGDSGNAVSIAMHSRVGFRPIGKQQSVGFKLGRWIDTVLMQRPLGAGDGEPPVLQGFMLGGNRPAIEKGSNFDVSDRAARWMAAASRTGDKGS